MLVLDNIVPSVHCNAPLVSVHAPRDCEEVPTLGDTPKTCYNMPCTEASLSDKFCLDPILFTESTNSDDIPSMKSPEGHHRRSVLGKLSGWWKKKSSYYVDIHHDLQQDNTIFPDEESMGLSENEIFDTTSLTPPKVANAESNLMSTRNLDTSPRKHSSVVKSTLNLHSPKTPTNSVCSPPRALRLHVLPTLSESRSGESHPHENTSR